MRRSEDTVSYEMADILDEMRANWKVFSQPLNVFKGSRKKPDILIREGGLTNVIIENEIEPANPNDDAINKLEEKYKEGDGVSAVIAVQIPKRFRNLGNKLKDELKSAVDLKYAVYNPVRFPKSDWLTGSLHDISTAAQITSVPEEVVKDCVDSMSDSIDSIADLIDKAGSSTKKNIAKLLFQKPNKQTWKMAGLILSNAFVFHNNIAGEFGIRTLREITRLGLINLTELSTEWEKILDVNYFAIFDIAKTILNYIDETTANEISTKLDVTSREITARGLARSTDMYGSLIQRMITDRKTLASFYTLPESAALLAGLVMPPPNSGMFNSPKNMKNIRVADFACGTGTLLTMAYKQMIMNYESGGGTCEKSTTRCSVNQ